MITATITTYRTAERYFNDIDDIRQVISDFNENSDDGFEFDDEPWVHGTTVKPNDYAVAWTINGEVVDELYIIKVHNTDDPGNDFCTCVTYDTNSALSEIEMPDGHHIDLDDLDDINEKLMWRRRRAQEAKWAKKAQVRR